MSQIEARLDNTPTTFTPQGPFRRSEHISDLQQARWDLRDDLRSITKSARVRGCGRTRLEPGVTVRLTNGVAGYVGLLICGRPWLCPVCAAKIAHRRGLEAAAGFDWWLNGDTPRPLTFWTGTAQHHAGMALDPLLDAVVKAWRYSLSGPHWMKDRDRLFIAGVTRTLEVLRSQRNGWHPHIHGVMPLGAGATEDQVAELAARFFGRWNRSLVRAGYDSLPIAQKCELIHPGDENAAKAIGRYISKMPDKLTVAESLGYELTAVESKAGRSSGRTPWQLGASAARGNSRDAVLWREYERATHNRRQMTWSPGLRSLLALGADQTDEQIAGEVLGSKDDAVVWISPEGWTSISRLRLGFPLLQLLKQSYSQYLRALTDLEIDYVQIRSHTT